MLDINNKKQAYNLTETDNNSIVCRYLTFPKFISLLTYQALWFSKLNTLQDQFEGTLPLPAKNNMHNEFQKWKTLFADPNLHKQIDEMPDRNVEDGRELTLVNCWYLGNCESKEMWDEYGGGSEGVAVKSTIRKLCRHIFVYPEFSQIGKVRYVNLGKHNMTLYEANQAHERAFLKDINKFSHEQEIRLVTMNLKTPYCVNMNGEPLTEQEYTGKNMNNFDCPGLYIGVNFRSLVDSIVLAPGSPKWIENLIKRIFELSKLDIIIERSQIEDL
jgi:hypothetical protein